MLGEVLTAIATPFDAEEAPDMVADVFGPDRVTVDRWDGPFTVLPDRDAVATYVRGRGISVERAAEVAASRRFSSWTATS